MSGIWEEAWDGVLPSHLVTEKIDADLACMVNAWAEHPADAWEDTVRCTFEMAKCCVSNMVTKLKACRTLCRQDMMVSVPLGGWTEDSLILLESIAIHRLGKHRLHVLQASANHSCTLGQLAGLPVRKLRCACRTARACSDC